MSVEAIFCINIPLSSSKFVIYRVWIIENSDSDVQNKTDINRIRCTVHSAQSKVVKERRSYEFGWSLIVGTARAIFMCKKRGVFQINDYNSAKVVITFIYGFLLILDNTQCQKRPQ